MAALLKQRWLVLVICAAATIILYLMFGSRLKQSWRRMGRKLWSRPVRDICNETMYIDPNKWTAPSVQISGNVASCRLSPSECCADWSEFFDHPVLSSDSDLSLEDTGSRQMNCTRILLIVLFNTPFFDNVPLIESLYGDAFSKVVFYADVENMTMGVQMANMSRGHYQHAGIAKAMKQYPNYDGYLWTGDDVFLNYPAILSRRNTSKVWTSAHDGPLQCFNEPPNRVAKFWHWPSGYEAALKGYSCLPDDFRHKFLSELGCYRCMAIGVADVGYVPRRYRTRFMELAYIYRSVFFEQSIPAMMRVIADNRREVERFHWEVYLWDWGKRLESEYVESLWNQTMAFVHPMKLSNEKHRTNARKWLKISLETFQYRNVNNICSS